MAEQQYTLAVVYKPGADSRIVKGVDGARDVFSEAELEKAAWSLLSGENPPEIGLFHQDGVVGHGRVVESYIWRADPWVMKAADGTEVVVEKGDWLAGIRWDDQAWDLIKSGRATGISIQGRGKRRAWAGQ
ncbi:MAG: XkdF-like putative serine protease domain-containing protein [Jatrophihabitans sp.]|uniref:XkdF-like putative serine protease domain-containing protein n=1 Tax=Jatrophihabitans sp. TaxID=1932789 RepID=UPI003F803FF5